MSTRTQLVAEHGETWTRQPGWRLVLLVRRGRCRMPCCAMSCMAVVKVSRSTGRWLARDIRKQRRKADAQDCGSEWDRRDGSSRPDWSGRGAGTANGSGAKTRLWVPMGCVLEARHLPTHDKRRRRHAIAISKKEWAHSRRIQGSLGSLMSLSGEGGEGRRRRADGQPVEAHHLFPVHPLSSLGQARKRVGGFVLGPSLAGDQLRPRLHESHLEGSQFHGSRRQEEFHGWKK